MEWVEREVRENMRQWFGESREEIAQIQQESEQRRNLACYLEIDAWRKILVKLPLQRRAHFQFDVASMSDQDCVEYIARAIELKNDSVTTAGAKEED